MSSNPGILVVHKGALGDFLQIWPSLYSLVKSWQPRDILWAGREAYQLWTRPLGIKKAPGRMVQAADKLYSAHTWPRELEGWQVFWFGLQQPPSSIPFPGLSFLRAIDRERPIHVRDNYLEQLQSMGIPASQDWPRAWLDLFAVSEIEQNRVLILPGAGHPAKCWPLAKFLKLAERLKDQGLRPVFVLGPVERERGVQVQDFESVQPGSLAGLQQIMASSALVLGHDSGPLHLAAYLARPTLALFGPSCPYRWGQYKARILHKNPGCSPCSLTARIDCRDPVCMRSLHLEEVWAGLQELLPRAKTKPASQD